MRSALCAGRAFALVFTFAADPLSAQETAKLLAYPAKPVRMVVPLAPGGGSDIIGRIVAQALSEHWGKPVVVDNRPGAGSAVGTSIAAKAPADGYTVLVSSSSIAISPALYKNLDFDVKRDFAGVTLIASQPSLLVVHPSVPVSNVKDLVALARSKPGRLAYASAGTGSATHLGSELLLFSSKTEMLHVPYKSAGQATAAVLAGEAQVLFTNMASVLPHVASGKLKALGISSLARSSLAREVPTIHESGIAGFEYSTWYGMLVPTGTRTDVVSYIHSSTAQVLKSSRIAERFAGQGLQTFVSSPAQFDTYLRTEVDRWARVVRAADIRIE